MDVRTTICPNCGAQTKASNTCEYCGSQIILSRRISRPQLKSTQIGSIEDALATVVSQFVSIITEHPLFSSVQLTIKDSLVLVTCDRTKQIEKYNSIQKGQNPITLEFRCYKLVDYGIPSPDREKILSEIDAERDSCIVIKQLNLNYDEIYGTLTSIIQSIKRYRSEFTYTSKLECIGPPIWWNSNNPFFKQNGKYITFCYDMDGNSLLKPNEMNQNAKWLSEVDPILEVELKIIQEKREFEAEKLRKFNERTEAIFSGNNKRKKSWKDFFRFSDQL